MRVIKNFLSDDKNNLRLLEGDIVEVLSVIGEHWAIGKREGSNDIGAFPLSSVQKIE